EVSDGQMGLAEVIGQIEATILIGLATAGVAFSEPIVCEKARKVDRPIREGEHPELRPSIFCSPCSPNKRRECTGKCRQFNGFGLVQAGSGPGGRWFKSIRPDQSFQALPCDFWFSVYTSVDDFVVAQILKIQRAYKLPSV